ncbi:clostripain-related cysteine peptidase [Pollutibacter soli]|uniref:clostripain-related cysteine peptidase n=1 Tax=Pollutibacter soli TaxID=3034157 RepID=UPI0030139065
MPRQNQRLWTVFFLVKSANDNILDLIRMVNEIRAIQMSSDVAVVFCLNVIKEFVPAVEKGDPELTNVKYGDTYTTRFYFLKQRNQICDGISSDLEFLSGSDDFRLTDPDKVSEYFRNQVLEFKAKKYMLITWDHANAFETFSDGPGFKKRLTIVKQSGVDTLTMDELAAAIGWAFRGKKIDVLIMCNCYMQSIETSYALRNHVKFVIAPERKIFFSGYNYPYIFELINKKPNIGPRKISKAVVDSFELKEYPDGIDYDRNNTDLFANNLRFINILFQIVGQIALHLSRENLLNREKIKNAREASLVSVADHLIDFTNFITVLNEANMFSDAPYIPQLYFTIIKELKIREFVGRDVKNQHNGLSTFFPSVWFANSSRRDFKQFFKTSFWNHSNWSEFVHRYIYPEGRGD